MRKITFFLSLLLTFAGVTSASAQAWRPGQRAATLSADKKYMLYNATYDTGGREGEKNRTGFLFNNGSSLGHSGSPKKKPSTFVTSENKYLWTIETTDTEYLYHMKSVSSNTYVGPAGVTSNADARNLYIQPWMTSQATKSTTIQTIKEDDTIVEITAEDNLYTISSTLAGGDCWNGNPDAWAKWSDAHPFAFYEAEEVRSAEEMEAYNAAKNKLNNAAFTLQNTYGLVTSGDKYTSNAKATQEGSYAALLDGVYNDPSHFHSAYNNNIGDYHYLQAELPEAVSSIRFYFKKRQSNNNNRPTSIKIMGSVDGNSFAEITTISSGLPTNENDIDYYSEAITTETSYKFYRFVVLSTNTGSLDATNGHPFFTFSEFYVLPGDNTLVNEVIDAKNTINALALDAENFNAVVSKCAGTYTELENAIRTVTINYIFNNETFQTTTVEALQGKTVTYTAGNIPYGLRTTEASKTITIKDNDNIVDFICELNPEETHFQTSTINGSFTADTKWYYLTQRDKYARYDETDNKIKNSTQRDYLLYRDLFAFSGDPVHGYKIYNYAAGATKVVGGAINNNAHVTMMNDADSERFTLENNSGHLVFRKTHSTNGYLNDIGGTLGYWTSASLAATDDGSTFTFEPVTLDDMAEIPTNEAKNMLTAAINKANQYTGTGDNLRLGNDLNLYTGITREELVAIVDGATALLAGTDKDAITAKAEELNTVIDNLQLYEVKQGKFYNIRCADGNHKYLTSDVETTEGDKKDRLKMGEKGKNSIFYFHDNQLLSYANGQYLNAMKFAEIGAAGSQASFHAGTDIKIGTYTLLSDDRWLFGSQNDNTLDSGTSTDARAGYTWWLEEVTALPVSIGSAGFATLWAPVALEIPEGVTAYTATLNEDKSTLELRKVNGVIPAKTGVVLKDEAGTREYNFNITTTENTATSSLTGQVNTIIYDKTTGNKVYTLQTVDESNVGFKVYGGKKLSGFKARLETNAEMQQALHLVFGDITGIGSVRTDDGNADTVFDLSGRRVAAPAKGIYIVNGKKVIFK